ncbi:hypothetical protein V8C40DRAFT_169100 [Trichoderma camerunense]
MDGWMGEQLLVYWACVYVLLHLDHIHILGVSRNHQPHPVNESYLLVHLFHAGSTIAADRKQAAVGATQHTTGAASPGLISCSLA